MTERKYLTEDINTSIDILKEKREEVRFEGTGIYADRHLHNQMDALILGMQLGLKIALENPVANSMNVTISYLKSLLETESIK